MNKKQIQEAKAAMNEWNYKKKLKESGFDDIETDSSIDQNYIVSQKFVVKPYWIRYNQKCVEHLNSGKIADSLDLFIFEKHCDGTSAREISRLLLQEKSIKLSHVSVLTRVTRILKEANIEPIKFPHT